MSMRMEQTAKVVEILKEKLDEKVYDIGCDYCCEISDINITRAEGTTEIEVNLINNDTYVIVRKELNSCLADSIDEAAVYFDKTSRTITSKFTVQFNNISKDDFLDLFIEDYIGDFNNSSGYGRIKNLCKNYKCDRKKSDTDKYIDDLFALL